MAVAHGRIAAGVKICHLLAVWNNRVDQEKRTDVWAPALKLGNEGDRGIVDWGAGALRGDGSGAHEASEEGLDCEDHGVVVSVDSL